MSEKTHTVAIGAFVTGAILIVITTIIFALGTGFGRDRSKVVMVFEGSVKGLTIGAPVALRGVQVGQVTSIELVLDDDTSELIMMVEAEIRGENIRRPNTTTESLTEELISRGLRAQLNTQSLLTGLLYVQLDFHPDSELNLVDIESAYLQIPTIPTELERFTRKLETIDFAKLADDVEGILSGLNQFATSEAFLTMPSNVQSTLKSVTGLSEQLSQQLNSSGPKLDSVLDGANTTFNTANDELPKLAALVNANMTVLQSAIGEFENSMLEFQGLVDHDSETVYELNQALRELSRAARAMKLLGKSLEEQPEVLLRGRNGDEQ